MFQKSRNGARFGGGDPGIAWVPWGSGGAEGDGDGAYISLLSPCNTGIPTSPAPQLEGVLNASSTQLSQNS